ncbi:ATP-binding protein Uup [Gammaproteobacteria bacterium]
MALLNLKDIHLAYGGASLLDGVDLQVEQGERLALVGRNGSGKSSLMRLIAGEIKADSGEVVRTAGLKMARLAQEVPPAQEGTVFDVVAAGLGPIGQWLAQYHHLSQQLADTDDTNESTVVLGKLAQLQHDLEAVGGWQWRSRVEALVSRLGLPAEATFANLSGGFKRRVMLGQALADAPNLLLLDEPTNHLDIPAIEWLEQFLLEFSGTLLFVTHDRVFLQRLATRIVELDRGHLASYEGKFHLYLERRAALLAAEERQAALFDKKLAREETWIRQGIKARRTRNEGRVRALLRLREERRARRTREGTVQMRIEQAESSGQIVVEAEDVSFSYDDGRPIFQGLTTTLLRGDRVGVIGPNGVGKTTLLRVLLGELPPTAGRLCLGTRLQVAYFDQLRSSLDEEARVRDTVVDGADFVSVGGERRHVIGYLQDFLFTPDRAHTPVKALSGGERNRLLLARLFARPSNILVMDEPTNDLDIDTLDLLEELLADYPGTLLLVSHDREFLDHVVTNSLVFEGNGRVVESVGGYEDWLRQRPAISTPCAAPNHAASIVAPASISPPRSRLERPRRLSFKEQQELLALPEQIEALEAEQTTLHNTMADPRFYQRPGIDIAVAKERLEMLEQELSTAYERWAALEAVGQ